MRNVLFLSVFDEMEFVTLRFMIFRHGTYAIKTYNLMCENIQKINLLNLPMSSCCKSAVTTFFLNPLVSFSHQVPFPIGFGII